MSQNSKTPKFDILIGDILKNLVPHMRSCKWQGEHKYCEWEFEVTGEDILFLKMFRVPPPNYCPTCRRMRRLTYASIFQFFQIKCQAPNHEETMLSVFSKECPFPVYDYKYFISDEFDPFSFGNKYKIDKSPLEQFWEFRKKFPVPSLLNRDPSCINSEYSSGGRNLKNGYYVSGCYGSENIWYSTMIVKSKEIMDSSRIEKSEYVYEGFASKNIYKSSFIYFSHDSMDSMFLFDCKNCNDCFGCVNLRNQKYCVFNKQLSKKDYESFLCSIYSKNKSITRNKIKEYEKKFWVLVKSLPMNASRNIAVENVSGVLLNNAKNIFDVNFSENSENIRHSDGALGHKDSMDVLYSGSSELLYEVSNVGSNSSMVKFSIYSKFSTDSEFLFNCKNVSNCFMCFGLQNKSFCVLNIQYSPEEYFSLLDEIKTKMMQSGEYGDGLGLEFSPQAYNFSLGQISFLLTDAEIIKLGGYLAKIPESNAGDSKLLSMEEIPQTIEEASDDIINFGIKCEKTGRPFRITASELKFLRNMKLPLPTIHPTFRMQSRLLLAPVAKQYSTQCAKCGKSIFSIFDPKENYILYCEKCYQREVY